MGKVVFRNILKLKERQKEKAIGREKKEKKKNKTLNTLLRLVYHCQRMALACHKQIHSQCKLVQLC